MTEAPFFNNEYNEVDKDGHNGSGVQLGVNSTITIQEMSELIRNLHNNINQKNLTLIILYVPVIVIAIVANILVIVVTFKNHYMRSVTNYFVVNLSMADLLVATLCMPMAVSQAVSVSWLYGEIMCKLFYYLQGVAVAASVFTITAMSIDRYLAIRSPITFRRIFNRKSTIMIIVAVWTFSLTIFAPLIRAVELRNPNSENLTIALSEDGEGSTIHIIKPPSVHICLEDFGTIGIHAHLFGIICFFLVYAIPGLVVVSAYCMTGRTLCARKPPFNSDGIEDSASVQQGSKLIRERRRVAWILLILAILFAFCWLPYNVLRLLLDLGVIGNDRVIANTLAYFLLLGHANSALNPVVYCFMTRNFRRCVSELLCHNRYGVARRKPHRKSLVAGAGARIDSAGINQHRTMLSHGHGSTRFSGILPQTGLQNSVTTSTACDSFDRHSTHQHCYMLKSTNPKVENLSRKTLSAETSFGTSLTQIQSRSLDSVAMSIHERVHILNSLKSGERGTIRENLHRYST